MKLVRFSNPHINVNRNLADELFNNFFKNDYHENHVSRCNAATATNVFETEKEFKIEVLLPGFQKDDLEMNVHNQLLTIKVEKEQREEKEEFKYARREFGITNFEKQYRLPKAVNVEEINAKFENGVLHVILPKREEALEKAPVEIKIS